MARRAPLSPQQAEAIAAEALAFLAEDADRLGRFLALSGLAPTDIRAQLNDAVFLGGVLDFVLGDDRLIVALAERLGLPPETPAAARRLLP
jgi:hypothetical protein